MANSKDLPAAQAYLLAEVHAADMALAAGKARLRDVLKELSATAPYAKGDEIVHGRYGRCQVVTIEAVVDSECVALWEIVAAPFRRTGKPGSRTVRWLMKISAEPVRKPLTASKEHIVEMNNQEREALIKWLQAPNGAHPGRRVTFESVLGGGVLVRTEPFKSPRRA